MLRLQRAVATHQGRHDNSASDHKPNAKVNSHVLDFVQFGGPSEIVLRTFVGGVLKPP